MRRGYLEIPSQILYARYQPLMFSTRGLQFQLTVYSTACLYVSAITETTTTTTKKQLYVLAKQDVTP